MANVARGVPYRRFATGVWTAGRPRTLEAGVPEYASIGSASASCWAGVLERAICALDRRVSSRVTSPLG